MKDIIDQELRDEQVGLKAKRKKKRKKKISRTEKIATTRVIIEQTLSTFAW